LQGLLDEKNSEFKALEQRKIEVERIAVLAKDFYFDLKVNTRTCAAQMATI
jgi:hypothetical protein